MTTEKTNIYDFIIIGQGLAGTVLAHTLEKEGATFKILDNSPDNSSSTICAGVYNPITGKRLVKTWLADEIFPFLEEFYTDLELKLGERFLYKSPIEVPIYTKERWEEAQKRLDDVGYEKWMRLDPTEGKEFPYNGNWMGTMTFQNSGYVDVKKMVEKSRTIWTESSKLSKVTIDYESIEISATHVKVNHWKGKRLVFCEGFRAIHNPYFNWLPFAPVKGEILEVESKGPSEGKILKSKGVFLLPLGNQRYKTGATYVWNDVTENPTDEGLGEIMGKFKSAYPFEASIKGQKAGVRPAIQDRRPVIGNHPEIKQLSIFNGLGTKGVSLAPYFASQAVDYWTKNFKLNPEVDAERFLKSYEMVKNSVFLS